MIIYWETLEHNAGDVSRLPDYIASSYFGSACYPAAVRKLLGLGASGDLVLPAKLAVDTINEKTGAAGVTIDGLLLKDGQVGPWDGWMSANEAWSYASATTITVPAGAASKYQKGDKIKYTAGGVIHYHYIITVADTLLTVVGDAVHNDTMTLNCYSRQTDPIGFPTWFDYTPSYAGTESMTYASVTTNLAKFAIFGQMVVVLIKCIGTTGGSASYGVLIGAPVVSADTGNLVAVYSYVNDGGIVAGFAYANDAAFEVNRQDGANFGLGANRSFRFSCSYRMA
jgi:hypothetical protein